MQLQGSSWVPALAAALRVTGQCHTQEFGRHMNFCSVQGPWEICPLSRRLVEVILRISNYFGLKFRIMKLNVTDLQPAEVVRGITVSRAVSCLNQWLSWFGVFF